MIVVKYYNRKLNSYAITRWYDAELGEQTCNFFEKMVTDLFFNVIAITSNTSLPSFRFMDPSTKKIVF